MKNKAFEKLFNFSKKTSIFGSIEQLLSWDQEIYMPKKAAEQRTEQLSLIAALIHKKKTSRTFKQLLSKLIDLDSGEYKSEELSTRQKAALREWRRDYLQEIKLPPKFVQEFAKTTSESINVWIKAREENNFKLFAPFLKKIIQLNQKKAQFLGFIDHPYNALLDLYEPGMEIKKIDPVFSNLKKSLTSLLKDIQNQPQIDDSFLFFPCSTETQTKLTKKIIQIMEIPEDNFRIDLSAHPFTTSLNPYDVRITTRFFQNFFISNLYSVLHEIGHAIYDMQLPIEVFGSPLGEAVSLGIHESQSRLFETFIGKSLSFCSLIYPYIQKIVKPHLDQASPLNFYKAVNKVSPSPIRVEADEVTYCLHIILRYEIEKQLIEGSLKIEDIPEAWNNKIKEYLNIIPATDSLGCLQDIHWSMGAFGYFPTYALGNIFAASFFKDFIKENPSYKEKIEINLLKKWLKEKIHKHGKTFRSKELVNQETFSGKAYLTYLKEKYSDIYGF